MPTAVHTKKERRRCGSEHLCGWMCWNDDGWTGVGVSARVSAQRGVRVFACACSKREHLNRSLLCQTEMFQLRQVWLLEIWTTGAAWTDAV